jgi:hypothetical protein
VTPGQAYKALAAFFGGLAALAGFFFLRLKWSHGTDMDVTGFFWLVANIGRLTLLLGFLICAGTALSYWLRSSRVR